VHFHSVDEIRSLARAAIYATPILRFAGPLLRGLIPSPRAAARHWDEQLADRLSPYLGGTLGIDLRNSATLQIVRRVTPQAASLLDVGCCGGALGADCSASGLARYVGVDVSAFAVGKADARLGEFHVADMRSFDPVPRGPFDVIVFNEVLYYVDVDEAAAQLHRYAKALARGGVLVVGMKDDPKSGAILARVVREFRWETAVLLQEQRAPGGFSVRTNRERPAYLVCAVRPLEGPR